MEIDRRIQLEFYILSNVKDYITINKIAKRINISDRTLKNDLVDLREYVKQSGGELIAKPGKGLKINIIDEKKFKENKLLVETKYTYVGTENDLIQSRSNQIAKILIIQDDYMKIDDIADKLYLSRSTIKQELKNVRKFFDSYGLNIISLPGKGMMVDGEEFKKRLCMIELINVHFPYSVYEEDDGSDFWQLFDNEEKMTIRSFELKILRNTKTTIVDNYLNKLACYSQLAKKRSLSGHKAKVGEMYKYILSSFKEYEIASMFASEFKKIDFVMDEDEIYCLELLLIFWRDLTDKTDIDREYPLFKDDVERTAVKALEDIKEIAGIDLLNKENIHSLTLMMIPIMARVFFNCSSIKITSSTFEKSSIRLSSIALYLGEIVAFRIKEEFDCDIGDYDIVRLAFVFYIIIDKMNFAYEPRNLILYFRNGYEGANLVRNKLIRYFGEDKFNRIDHYEFYEGRIVDESQYDYAIMNFKDFTYRYNLPYIKISQIPTRANYDEINEKIIIPGYRIESLIDNIEYKSVDYEFDNMAKLAQDIAYDVSNSIESHKIISDRIINLRKLYIKNKVANIIVDSRYCKENCFIVYRLNKTVIFKDNEVNYFVFTSFRVDEEKPELIKSINIISEEFTRSLDLINDYVQSSNKKAFVLNVTRQMINM